MRVSVIDVRQSGTRWAVGMDNRDAHEGHMTHHLDVETCLYMAAGTTGHPAMTATNGVVPTEILLVVAGPVASLWSAYAASDSAHWSCVQVGAWTRWRHHVVTAMTVWVLLLDLATEEDMPPAFDGLYNPGAPSPVRLMCQRLLHLARIIGCPWTVNAGQTAHRVLRRVLKPDPDLRGIMPDRRVEPYWGTGRKDGYPMQAGGDLLWERKPLKDEVGLWIHSYDANAARLAAMGVAVIADDKPEGSRGPIAFDPDLHGYWTINRSDITRAHLRPHPNCPPLIDVGSAELGPTGNGSVLTVTTPIMAEWMRQGVLPPVADAWVASGRRAFRTVAEAWNRARIASFDEPYYLESVKAVYRAGAGLFASPGGLIFRPDWYHTINDRQRVTLWTRIIKVHERTGRWPLKVHTDAVWYATESTATAFADAAGLSLDPRNLGSWKIQGTRAFFDVFPRKVRSTKA